MKYSATMAQDDIMVPSVVKDVRDSSRDPSERRLDTNVEDKATALSTRVIGTDVNIVD